MDWAGLFDLCRVDIWLEANQGSVTEIEHRALDHRGLCEHQFDAFRLVEIGFAFVLALRHVPLFPRFLAGVWVIDVLMQICIARVMAQVADLPGPVGASLADMLEGNLKKVLISVAIWLHASSSTIGGSSIETM